jgi:hypothetical protein
MMIVVKESKLDRGRNQPLDIVTPMHAEELVDTCTVNSSECAYVWGPETMLEVASHVSE